MIAQFLSNTVENWQDEKYLLAVSGGVDSMVLLHQFVQIFGEDAPRKIIVVHINHQLRKQSIKEEQLVETYCQKYHLPFRCYHWKQGPTLQSGVEEQARLFRYQKFQEVMEKERVRYVVLAHHGDDQLETILMKLTRGSTLKGISGMKKKRSFANGYLLRPLLEYEKSDLYEEANRLKIPFLEDDSNASQEYTRNRYRHVLIPFFKKEQPKVVEHGNRFSLMLEDCLQVLEPIVSQKFEQMFVFREGMGWFWNKEVWMQESPSMQRLLLEQLSYHLPNQFGYTHIQAIQKAIIREKPQLELFLSKEWRFIKTYQQLAITKSSLTTQDTFSQKFQVFSTQMDPVALSPTEVLEINSERTDGFSFEVERQSFPLTIRHREPQDRFIVNQKGEHQTIKRWCINQKIPKHLREELWVVETHEKKIIAILGFRKPQSLSKSQETDKIRIFYRKDDEV